MANARKSLLAVSLLMCSGVQAETQSRPAVVELFTSQGCSSCPPAEAYIGELAQHKDVLALSFHVDYWDDLGWKDPFSLGISTQRQSVYSAARRRSSVYTPQVVIDGKDDFVLLIDVRKNGIPIGTDVTVLRSRGDGTFDALEPFRIADTPQIMPNHRVLSGDLNHDGKPDLVIRCMQDLVVLLGTGGGRFAVKGRHLPQNANFGTQSARLGDVDGDGNPDVILPAYRGIRVFFSDGRGNFTRTAQASIAKTHEIELPPDLAFLNTTNINEPRDLALGHFTRTDRMQIAAGTLEGDIVVFSYERGGLQEVSRTRTEFWYLAVRSGHFRGSGTGDDCCRIAFHTSG